MCIAIKTYSCGVIEHHFDTECTDIACKKYVRYLDSPGECVSCMKYDNKALVKTARESFLNTPTKAFAEAHGIDESLTQGTAKGVLAIFNSIFPESTDIDTGSSTDATMVDISDTDGTAMAGPTRTKALPDPTLSPCAPSQEEMCNQGIAKRAAASRSLNSEHDGPIKSMKTSENTHGLKRSGIAAPKK